MKHHPGTIGLVLPGAADLLLMRLASGGAYAPRNCYVLWLELKAPGKKPTKTQLEFRERVDAIGCDWNWEDSVDDAIAFLKAEGWCR